MSDASDALVQPMGGAAPATAPKAAIELDRCRRDYGERTALEDVTVVLEPGQTLVVFGPNGAGKTTLLRILATLLRPHSGGVRVLGCELPGQAWRARGRIGLLGHEPLLYRELTARENLRYYARLHGVDDGRVEERLRVLGLADRWDEPLRTLSRGTVQRVAVARATLHDPELLLLDEPYANLDPAAIELVSPLIGAGGDPGPGGDPGTGGYPGTGGDPGTGRDPARLRTRVLCSHDPSGGLAEADLVLGLRAGRTALLGPASEIDASEITELYR